MKYKNLLLKIHFGLVLFVISNFIFRQFTDIPVCTILIFIFKICIYISGLTLLFLTFRPFEKKAIYFSIYLLSPIGVLISWLVDGVLGAIISSLFMWIFTVDNYIIKNKDYKITKPLAGFMAPCCKYDLKKSYYYLIEKEIGEFWFEPAQVKFITFIIDENKQTIKLSYQFDRINNIHINDTTITLN